MKEFIYIPKGVCSSKIQIKVENDKLIDINIVGGCRGNLEGIKSLIIGMDLNDIVSKLNGIKCGLKETSCPDQISKAILKYQEIGDKIENYISE